MHSRPSAHGANFDPEATPRAAESRGMPHRDMQPYEPESKISFLTFFEILWKTIDSLDCFCRMWNIHVFAMAEEWKYNYYNRRRWDEWVCTTLLWEDRIGNISGSLLTSRLVSRYAQSRVGLYHSARIYVIIFIIFNLGHRVFLVFVFDYPIK